MIWVCPVIFCGDPERARRAFEVEGLATVTHSQRGTWAELRGTQGAVAIHVGEPESVQLSFITDAPEETLQTLLDAGYDDAHIWDEAYGREIGLTAPHGEMLWISADQEDFYGYEHTETPQPTGAIECRMRTPHIDEWAHLLTTLGATQAAQCFTFPSNGGHIYLERGSTTEMAVQTITASKGCHEDSRLIRNESGTGA